MANLSVAILGVAFALSAVAVAVFLILPLALKSGAYQGSKSPLLFFVAIGLGYIMVEITFIQRFVLFLGHPVYALTVVVFLMLLSSGIGSLLSGCRLRNPEQASWVLAFICLVLIVYAAGLPCLLGSLVGLPVVVKLAISAALLIPLGLAMGIPFPSGLRALSAGPGDGSLGTGAIEWAWAVNAGSSVLGSVVAVIIAVQFGMNVALICGVVAYLCALLLMRPSFHGSMDRVPL
jgi:hypothetical protein